MEVVLGTYLCDYIQAPKQYLFSKKPIMWAYLTLLTNPTATKFTTTDLSRVPNLALIISNIAPRTVSITNIYLYIP